MADDEDNNVGGGDKGKGRIQEVETETELDKYLVKKVKDCIQLVQAAEKKIKKQVMEIEKPASGPSTPLPAVTTGQEYAMTWEGVFEDPEECL